MNYKETGQKILDAIGGKEKVQNLVNCAKSLCFTLAYDKVVQTI